MPPPALPARAPPPFYGAPPSCQCGLPTVTTARSSLPAPLSPSTDATACPRYVNTVYQSHLVCFPRIYQFLVHPSQRPIVSLPHRFASRPPSIRLPTGHKRSPHAPISVRSLFVHPPVITARSSLPAPLSPSTGATACPRYVNTVCQSHLVCFPRIYQFLVHPPSALLFHSPTVSLPVRPPFVYSHKRSRPTSPLLPLLRLPSHMHTPVTAMRPTSLIRVTSPTSVHFASLIPARFLYHSASRPPLSPSVVTIAHLSPVQKDALK